MTSNFEPNQNLNQNPTPFSDRGQPISEPQPHHLLDGLKRDRFELLSAYLDHEVTTTERRQVEEWLDTDPVVQRLYVRLLQLRQGLQTAPVPRSQQSTEQVQAGVLRHLARRSRATWAGTAIAALFVAAVAGLVPGVRSPFLENAQMAKSDNSNLEVSLNGPTRPRVTSDSLMIALDRPVVDIPKAPVSAPESPTWIIQTNPN
ncbi:hypothetical protein BST81_03945 [Leptolyngbya sp. 'hensonii']|uniref:anti-sigma factor family protein n=1 Tax=Leptolyngbya sp. 'hensonii' TaxID=1922337 RepID=UPI00094FC3C1|nr:hypothetical protein [Leptolyngbya sp. 'hensonii']OLP19701.1 hypothetical protein BST81_03945 [Leptolyngbya sp. 'hensonii']